MSDPTGHLPKWLRGALNIVSGAFQFAAGAALGATVGWTGVGAVAAALLVANGVATTMQGIGQVVNSVANKEVLREDNFIRTGVEDVGRLVAGDTGAAVAGVVYDTAITAASMYAGINTKSGCFIAGTAILTGLGARLIENIEKGDLVWAKDPQNGEVALKRVVQTFVHESNELVNIVAGGEVITATTNHPFYVASKGWTAALELRAGDMLVRLDGTYVIVEFVQHEILENPIKVYNFEVEDFHTYFVGTDGLLVHNVCGKRNTPDQDAVIQLAKSNKKGISMENAKTLVEWANEYNLPGNPRIDMGHIGRGAVSQGPHAHIGPVNHIPIF